MRGEGDHRGAAHSRYDTYENHVKFVDPGFVYGALQAKTLGRMVIKAADTDLPLQNGSDFADAAAQYVAELKTLAGGARETAESRKARLADNVYSLAADPTKPHANPAVLTEVPKFDFTPLDQAVANLHQRTVAYDDALLANGANLSHPTLLRLHAVMLDLDRALLSDAGLPGRGSWYKNLVYAPGRFTGYGSKTMPGVREALEEERWSDAARYIGLTADAFECL